MNAVLDKPVSWKVYADNVVLRLGTLDLTFSVPHSAILERWQIEGRWWEDGLDRRYYRVELPDGRIGDFYENEHGQFLERWREAMRRAG